MSLFLEDSLPRLEFYIVLKLIKYLRRIFRKNQMDFEFASWQAFYLPVNPQQVYRNFAYRKQTKNQYARDDPAFLVLISIILTFTAGLSETDCFVKIGSHP